MGAVALEPSATASAARDGGDEYRWAGGAASLLAGGGLLIPSRDDQSLRVAGAVTASFGAVPAQAQLTLTALLLAFGASQLFWGPLSDRIGRRRVLLIGLAGYTLAAVGSALAGSIEVMVFWRVLQGAFMGAGTVCARAIVRDLYAPQEGARAMSKGLSGLGVAACLSPPLGGVLAEWFGWRATLAALTVMGAATLFVVARHFQETLHERHPEALQPAVLLRTARAIVGNRSFWTCASLCTASFGGLFCILSASSFVFINLLGTSPSFYGVLLLLLSAFYIGGTMLCRRMIQRFGVQRSVMIGGALSLSGGGLMLAFILLQTGFNAFGVVGRWTVHSLLQGLLAGWIHQFGRLRDPGGGGCRQPVCLGQSYLQCSGLCIEQEESGSGSPGTSAAAEDEFVVVSDLLEISPQFWDAAIVLGFIEVDLR